jgi:hypothetical protein
METNLDYIYIFRTNIGSVDAVCTQKLDEHPDIQQWSVDTADPDCVLRIVSQILTANDIAALIQQLGYECTELD